VNATASAVRPANVSLRSRASIFDSCSVAAGSKLMSASKPSILIP